MTEPQRWATGMLEKPRGKGGWSNHIGRVNHAYGPYMTMYWVKTLCGRTGRMGGRTTQEPKSIGVDCKVCLKSFAKLVQVEVSS